MNQEVIIAAALLLDLLLGDPKWFPHPVRGIGFIANGSEIIFRRLFSFSLRFAGICAAVTVIAACGLTSWLLIYFMSLLHPVAGIASGILIIYFSIAPRDLYDHSIAVYKALKTGSITDARKAVGMIVGRDVSNINEKEIIRASVETVGESLVDGVTAPLFYAILFGPVGAFVYRAINTLDSMFGHKNERYLYFGWASARIDDLANYLPARITVPFIILASSILRLDIKNCIRIFLRDRRKHHSPNSGLSEAAFAGAMNIELGGLNYYDGIPDHKPLIGDKLREMTADDIKVANKLMLATAILFTIGSCIVHFYIVKVLLCRE